MNEIIDNSPRSCIYAIFDVVSGTNIQYFDSCNDDTAIRLVQQNAKNPQSFLYKQRKDLILYRLFEYAPKSGETVLNREAIYNLSALPEYDEKPFGIDKLEDYLKQIMQTINELKQYNNTVVKLQEDNDRLRKQANVSFIDKLFNNSKEIKV